MGKVTIQGKATRTVPYDRMNITVRFQAWGATPADVLRKIEKQCEKFLGILQSMGYDIGGIQMKKANLSEERSTRDNPRGIISVSGEKSLLLKATLHPAAVNGLERIIRENELDADYSVSYDLSDRETLRRELLGEAVEDSRHKADIIAASVGTQVVGMKQAGNDGIGHAYKKNNDEYFDIMSIFNRSESLSDRLSALETTVEESITITWITE